MDELFMKRKTNAGMMTKEMKTVVNRLRMTIMPRQSLETCDEAKPSLG